VTRARVDSSPAISGGRVFVGSSDGKLYVLDTATGAKSGSTRSATP
jgi:outer membrane protein assembly factor BamB